MSTGWRTALWIIICAWAAPPLLAQPAAPTSFPMSRLPPVALPPSFIPTQSPHNPYEALQTERDTFASSAQSSAGRLETLGDAWGQALAVDQQLSSQAASVEVAALERDAASAQRYPSAGLAGQYTVRNNDQSFLINTPLLPYTMVTPYQQAEDFAFEGLVDLPLYTGGRVTNQVAAAECRVEASQCQLSRRRLDLKMAVADLFVAVLRAEQELKVAESHERSLASHAHDTQLLHVQQRVPRNDLLAAQVAQSDAQHQVIRARSDLDAARAAYNRQLGRPLTASVQLAALQASGMAFDVDMLTGEALARRQELSQLDAQIAAHRHEAEVAAAENRAQIHAQGGYAYRENRYQTPNGITAAAVGVEWNLFDGGRARNRAAAQQQRAQVLAHLRADLQSQIQLEVRRAWLSVEETRQRLQVTRQAIERAEENLRVTRQRYGSGMATNTDVLSAESLRIQSYRNHNNAIYDAALAELRLHRAAGSL